MSSIAAEEFASVRERFFATVIDGLLLTLVSVIFIGLLGQIGIVLSIVGSALYHWYWWTHFTGQTPGKKIINIRIIKADGSEITDTDAFVRYLAGWLSVITFGFGWLIMQYDSHHQSLHDKIAATVVIKNY
jgi:uncharacterized RDD family membrane protein YckC